MEFDEILKLIQQLKNEEKIAVHCYTEGAAEQFCQLLIDNNITWFEDKYTVVTKYDRYKDETCYFIQGNQWGGYCRLTIGDVDYAKDKGVKLITFKATYDNLKDIDEEMKYLEKEYKCRIRYLLNLKTKIEKANRDFLDNDVTVL